MADDETQGSVDTWWEASDAASDPLLPSMGFDEPLVWPETPVWDDIAGPLIADFGAGDEGELFLPLAADIAPFGEVEEPAPAVEVARPPDPDAQWRPAAEPVEGDHRDPEATVQLAGPLAALGGASGPVPHDSSGNVPWPAEAAPIDMPPSQPGPVGEPAVASIWSNDRRPDPNDLVGFAGVAGPAIYADTDRSSRGLRWRRFNVRPGNAAVVGLISVVSLVLLGMFLSVRARNDVPTDASKPRTVANDITATGPVNTTPQTTAVATTTTVPPAINLSELAQTTETTTAAASSGSGASATTTPTTRSAAPTTSAPATTTPTTQATVTTEAPPPTTEVTSPPVSDNTQTTSRPSSTITIPAITMPSGQTFPIPDMGRLQGLINRDTDR